jgi:CheY-like chemotaxis protein
MAKVLVVDDEPVVRELLRCRLEADFLRKGIGSGAFMAVVRWKDRKEFDMLRLKQTSVNDNHWSVREKVEVE